MELFTHDVKNIKGATDKNGLKNVTCKQSLKKEVNLIKQRNSEYVFGKFVFGNNDIPNQQRNHAKSWVHPSLLQKCSDETFHKFQPN